MPEKKGKFKFVCIPADVSEPLQELTQDYTERDEVECLLNRVKAHFKSKKPAKSAEQLARQREQLLANVPPEQRDKIDEGMLSTAADLGMVENIALLSNSRDNGYIGVNLYCDDEASFIDAPLNPRASEIAFCCGKQMQVQGDVFLARVFDNEDDFQRLDLGLREVSSSAPWVKDAFQQNERKKKADSADVVLQRMQQDKQPKAAPTTVHELTPGEAEKESGNAAFKKGDFKKAIGHYTKAVELDSSLASAYSNRAMAHLKLGQVTQAETDCNHTLLLQPDNVKALLRRATARSLLNRPREALEDYVNVQKLEPNNKEAKQKCELLQSSFANDVEQPAFMPVDPA